MSAIKLSDIMKSRMGDLALENMPALQAKFDAKVDKSAISSSVVSASAVNVANSAAVKSAYDKATVATNIANTAKTAADDAKASWSNLPNAKSDAVNVASSGTLATSAAAKTAYDKGVAAYNLADAAQRKADSAYVRWSNLPNAKSDSVTLNNANYLATSKAVFTLKGTVDHVSGVANAASAAAAAARSHADSLFSNKTDSVTNSSSSTLATAKAVKTAYDRLHASIYYGSSAKVTATSVGASINGSLAVSSAITAGGDITAFSDVRLKSNIHTLTDALDALDILEGKRYIMNDAAKIGFIAQEVQAVYPELVLANEDGILSLNYMGLIPVLWNAVRELREVIVSAKL